MSFFNFQNTLRLHSDKKYTRKKIWKRTMLGILTGTLLLMGSCVPAYAAETNEERIEIQRAMTIQSNETENWPVGPVVNAESAILIEAGTGTILYAKNVHQQEYPASTTKLLTCLIAAETCSLDEIVTFSQSAVSDTPRDSSHIAIDAGEELTMEQSLNAILIASANEVSFAVAEHISGTWEDFAVLMNEKATELGCLNSNFINPNGLPDDNHYTTAYDLAMIGRAFFDQELLCKISSTAVLDIPASEKQPDHIIEYSKNQLIKGEKYEYLVGSKTGYTNAARNCLVTCAEKDGLKLICVVMKDESPLQFEDTLSLFDYGFSNFEKINISQTETKYNIDNAGSFYSENSIFGSVEPIISLNSDGYIILPNTAAFEDTVSTISYNTDEEDQVAVITYTYHDVFIGSVTVDLATAASREYSFEMQSLLPAETAAEEETQAQDGPAVIFINVVKVFFWVLGITAGIVIILFARFAIKNYNLDVRKNVRSGRRKDLRKRLHHNQVNKAVCRSEHTTKRSKKNQAKHPDKFRDNE